MEPEISKKRHRSPFEGPSFTQESKRKNYEVTSYGPEMLTWTDNPNLEKVWKKSFYWTNANDSDQPGTPGRLGSITPPELLIPPRYFGNPEDLSPPINVSSSAATFIASNNNLSSDSSALLSRNFDLNSSETSSSGSSGSDSCCSFSSLRECLSYVPSIRTSYSLGASETL